MFSRSTEVAPDVPSHVGKTHITAHSYILCCFSWKGQCYYGRSHLLSCPCTHKHDLVIVEWYKEITNCSHTNKPMSKGIKAGIRMPYFIHKHALKQERIHTFISLINPIQPLGVKSVSKVTLSQLLFFWPTLLHRVIVKLKQREQQNLWIILCSFDEWHNKNHINSGRFEEHIF